MIDPYKEPELSICVLDFCKPYESRFLLESIRRHIKVPHKVIFCDNGSKEEYPVKFFNEGLIDQLIINKESLGLGLGTRDVINACQSEWFIYMQNDQVFYRDFAENDFAIIKNVMAVHENIKSISLFGYNCGEYIYNERAHIMKTSFYKSLEPLSFGGAGKWQEYPWREGQIQEIYRKNNWIHFFNQLVSFVQDGGVYAIRDMGDGGVFLHRTDTKAVFVIVPPKEKNSMYPKVTQEEFELMKSGKWQDGRIPEIEMKDSFTCWQNSELVKHEAEYVADLRKRFENKKKQN